MYMMFKRKSWKSFCLVDMPKRDLAGVHYEAVSLGVGNCEVAWKNAI